MAYSLSRIGYILALIGGIIILLFGILDILGVVAGAFRIFSLSRFFSGTLSSIVQVAIGVVCIIGSKYVRNIIWAIVLLILGIIADNPGGLLVIIGAIIGLVSTLLKSAPK